MRAEIAELRDAAADLPERPIARPISGRSVIGAMLCVFPDVEAEPEECRGDR